MAKKIGIGILTFIVTYFFQYYIGLEYSSLNDKLIEIYSLVIAIYSMYAVYFTCIQFLIQLKNENSFFGINYVSEKIDKIEEIKFSKTKCFFLLLFLFGVLPILFIRSIIIVRVWISILLILIILFLTILYKVFNLFFVVSDDYILKKQLYCYEIVVEKINNELKKIYNDYENNDEFNEEEKVFFLERILKYYIITYVESLKDNEEKIYVYNTILGKLNIKNKLKLKSFYMWYFDMFLEKNIELISVKKIEEDGKKFYLSYPLLDAFADLDRSDECFDTIKKIVLNNKTNIDSLLILIFLFEIIHNYSLENMKELLDIINIFSQKNYTKDSKGFVFNGPINSELIYRLFLKGDKVKSTETTDLKKENIKKVWKKLFMLDKKLLEFTGTVRFSNTNMKITKFDVTNNIYMEAKEDFFNSVKKA